MPLKACPVRDTHLMTVTWLLRVYVPLFYANSPCVAVTGHNYGKVCT